MHPFAGQNERNLGSAYSQMSTEFGSRLARQGPRDGLRPARVESKALRRDRRLSRCPFLCQGRVELDRRGRWEEPATVYRLEGLEGARTVLVAREIPQILIELKPQR